MSDATQIEVWNALGASWVRHGEHFDATLEPFGRAVMEQLDLQPGERVLDIGGGAGATTIELSRRVAPGEVVSVDVSAPMVAAAQERIVAAGLDNARALVSDVESYARDLAPSRRFDAAFSRMGVMFFEDPLDAFAAIASALVPGGRLGFVCFADLAANPFISVAVGATIAILDVTLPHPDGPGPFSLADPNHIERLLAGSGFHEVSIVAGPAEADLGSGEDLDAMAQRLLEQNPSTALGLARATPEVRSDANQAVVAALAELRRGDRIVGAAGTWLVTAHTDR